MFKWMKHVLGARSQQKTDDFDLWMERQMRLKHEMKKSGVPPLLQCQVLLSKDNAPPKPPQSLVMRLLTALRGPRQKAPRTRRSKLFNWLFRSGKQFEKFESTSAEFSRRRKGQRATSATVTNQAKSGLSDEAIGELLGIQLVEDSAIEHFKNGQKHTEAEHHQEAINEYLSAISIEPNYVDAHVALGVGYFSIGRYDEAIEKYSNSLQLAQEFTPEKRRQHAIETILVNICSALRARGVTKSSIGEFTEIVTRLEAPPPMHHACLGLLYEELGHNGKARSEYDKLVNAQKTGPWSDFARDKLK